MDTSFVASDESLSIYKIRFMPSELTNLYNDILPNVTTSEVHDCLCKYVTSSIEPIGWHSIWRTAPNTGHNQLSSQYDFEVEVIDVMHNRLEAIGVVLKLIYPKESELTAEQFDEKEKLLKETKIVAIPLAQLYVISDNDEHNQFYRTAVIIEQIRFFYSNLWRPWDELAGTDGTPEEVFIESKLKPRLELSFDIKDKTISESTVNRIKHLLSEAWALKHSIDSMNSNKTFELLEMSVEDNSDIDYINETDLLEAMRMKLRLEDIEREMKLLEDKHFRTIAVTLLKKNVENNVMEVEDRNEDSKQNKIHLIAKSFTLKSTKDILNTLSNVIGETDCPVMFHNTFSHALNCIKSGDKIYLMPGLYTCPVLPWIERDIEINGLGESNGQIIIESNDSNGDIFLNCNSNKVLFSGLTLRATSELQCLVMIHSGFVAFNDCVIDGQKHTRNGIIVLSKAKVETERFKIIKVKEKLIVGRKGSVVIDKDIDKNLNLKQIEKTNQIDINSILKTIE